MDIQRLRNLTTGKLHTKLIDIYKDLELITCNGGIMPHMIPRVMRAVEPWLQSKVADERFWGGKHDPSHVGEYWIPTPTIKEHEAMMERYKAMPDPLADKDVIVVEINSLRK